MQVQHKITAIVESFKGLEKRRSDLMDKPGHFNELKNAAFRSSGAINKRKGFHKIVSHQPLPGENLTQNDLGIASYTPKNELLVMNDNLKKVNNQIMTVTNNSTTDDVIASFLPNEDNKLEYRFKSRSTGVTVDIGTGQEDSNNTSNISTTEENTATLIPAKDSVFNYYITNAVDNYEQYWKTSLSNSVIIPPNFDISEGLTFTFSGSNILSSPISMDLIDITNGTTGRRLTISSDPFNIIVREIISSGGIQHEYSVRKPIELLKRFENSRSIDYTSDIYSKVMIRVDANKLQVSACTSKTQRISSFEQLSIKNFTSPIYFNTSSSTSAKFFKPITSSGFGSENFSLESMSISVGDTSTLPLVMAKENGSLGGSIEGTLAAEDIMSLDPTVVFYPGNGDSDSISVNDPANRSVNVFSHGDNQAVGLDFVSKVANTSTDAATTFLNQMNVFTEEQEYQDIFYGHSNNYYNNNSYITTIGMAESMRADKSWTISTWIKATGGASFNSWLDDYYDSGAQHKAWGLRYTLFNAGPTSSRMQSAPYPLGTDLTGLVSRFPLESYYYLNTTAATAMSDNTQQTFWHLIITNKPFIDPITNTLRHTTTTYLYDAYGNSAFNQDFFARTADVRLDLIKEFKNIWVTDGGNLSNFDFTGGNIDELSFFSKALDESEFNLLREQDGLFYIPKDLTANYNPDLKANYRFGDNSKDNGKTIYSTTFVGSSSGYDFNNVSAIGIAPPPDEWFEENDISKDDFVDDYDVTTGFPLVLAARNTSSTPFTELSSTSNIKLSVGQTTVSYLNGIGFSNYLHDETTTTTMSVRTQTISSPVMLDSVVTTINNFDHVDLTATVSDPDNGTTTPSAFVIPIDETVIPRGESISLRYFTEEDVAKGDSSYNYFGELNKIFLNDIQNLNDVGRIPFSSQNQFRNVSHTILNNNMYFATGFDEICKYDGNKIYRAGLPQPGSTHTGNTYVDLITGKTKGRGIVANFLSDHAVPDPEDPIIFTEYIDGNGDTQTVDLTGGLEPNDSQQNGEFYGYMLTYRHVDNNYHIISSTQSPVDTTSHYHGGGTVTKHFVEVEVPTIQAGTGFDLTGTEISIWRSPKNTTQSVAAASSFYQVTTEDSSGNPIEKYLINKSDLPTNYADYINVEEEDPVTPTTRCYISNGFIVNDPNVTSIKYLDFLDDSMIVNNQFILMGDYAEGRHDLPPMTSHITNHQGCLVLANSFLNNTELYYSLPEFNFATGEIGSEYFPLNSNSVLLDGFSGGPITGVKTLKETLFVFHEKSVSVLSGDLTSTGVQYLKKDSLSSQAEIGSISKDCFLEYESSLTFLSEEGIMTTNTQASYPQELSKNIKPLLLPKNLDRTRSISFFTAEEDVMGFFIPVKDTNFMDLPTSKGIFNDSTKSKLFVFDVNVQGWLEWDNIDMSGGVCRHDGETFFLSRQKGVISLNIFKTASDKSSYSDFNQPIDTQMITSWNSAGNSAIFKKYVRLKVFCTDSHQEFEGNSFKLNLYLRSNFDNKDIGPIVLDPGSFGGWGIPYWGEFSWGSRDFQGIRTKLFGKSKSIALHFSNNTINENILMSGYAMEIVAPYQMEIKE